MQRHGLSRNSRWPAQRIVAINRNAYTRVRNKAYVQPGVTSSLRRDSASNGNSPSYPAAPRPTGGQDGAAIRPFSDIQERIDLALPVAANQDSAAPPSGASR